MQNSTGEEKTTEEDTNNKKTKNLYNALVKDQKSIFYATDRITNNLLNKARVSIYLKDKVFVNIYQNLGNKNIPYYSICRKETRSRSFNTL